MGYCLDDAVWTFGCWVDEQVDQAGASKDKHDTDKKRQVRMQRAFERCMGLQPKFRSISG